MHGRTNLTAMRLMDACEHLLCEAEALEDLTARRIAIEAHATPSAISYHFGSQEELVAAVAERVYRRLNAERLSLLRRAADRRAPDPPDLDEVIAALVGPSIRWSLDPTSSYPVLSHFTSMAKTHRERAPHYRRIIDDVEHHRAFIPHLEADRALARRGRYRLAAQLRARHPLPGHPLTIAHGSTDQLQHRP